MNPSIFRDIFDSDTVVKAMISTLESEDDLGCFLRLHLISETYLEAFISSSLNISDLFADSPSDGIALQMNYASKAQLALKLGLNKSGFKALMLLNKNRNKAAHSMGTELITKDLLNNLKNHAYSIGKRKPNELKEHVARFYNDDGTLKADYKFDSDLTPARVKLMIILAAVFNWVAEEANVLITSPSDSQ